MNQSMANVGEVNENWKLWVLVWVLSVMVVSVAADLGFFGTLFGTAGRCFVYWSVKSLVRAVSSRSVTETTIGTLGGQSTATQLVGHAKPVDEPLTAPLSGADCVAYQVQVREYRPNRQGGE